MQNVSTLRPGLLVSLKTSVSGNVSYKRRDVETEHRIENGATFAKWETDRTITDAEEYDMAIKVRSKCRSLVTAVCSASTFGMLCPETSSAELGAAVAEAQSLAEAFNRDARLTRIGVFVIAGRIAQDDVEAVKAINSEVADLMSAMERGMQNLDAKVVRDAAAKAKNIGQMLTPDAAARIQVAIDAARSAARKIIKAGEQAAGEIDQRAIRAVRESRTAFLDMSSDYAVEVAMPATAGREIDMEPAAAEPDPVAPVARAFDMADFAAAAAPVKYN